MLRSLVVTLFCATANALVVNVGLRKLSSPSLARTSNEKAVMVAQWDDWDTDFYAQRPPSQPVVPVLHSFLFAAFFPVVLSLMLGLVDVFDLHTDSAAAEPNVVQMSDTHELRKTFLRSTDVHEFI